MIAYLSNSYLDDSFANVTVTGNTAVSALIGQSSDSTITKAYSKGSVEADSLAGGLIARMYDSSLQNSFSAATVQAGTYFGSIIGEAENSAPSTITNVYFDGSAPCVGLGGTGMTCTEIDTNSSPNYFKGTANSPPLDTWDFESDIWRVIPGDYPDFMAVPQSPDNVMAVATDNTIAVSWDAPPDNGGREITAYQMQYITPSGTVIVPIFDANVRSYTITGLSPLTEYIVSLRAVNAIGSSGWQGFILSTKASAVTPSSSAKIATATFVAQTTNSDESTTYELVAPETVEDVAKPIIGTAMDSADNSLVIDDTSDTLLEISGYLLLGTTGLGLLLVVLKVFGAKP